LGICLNIAIDPSHRLRDARCNGIGDWALKRADHFVAVALHAGRSGIGEREGAAEARLSTK
jgi:hypothetical protein